MVEQTALCAERTSGANSWRLVSECETEKERQGDRRLKMRETKGKVAKSSDSAALNNVAKTSVQEFFSLVRTKLASLAR